MLSAGEAAKQRRFFERERAKHVREKDRETVRRLGEQLHAARVERNQNLAKVSAEGRAIRVALRDKAHERRKKTLADLRETYARERAQAREEFLRRKEAVIVAARDPIERATRALEAERKYRDELRRIERANRSRHRAVKRAHAEERRGESDDVVRSSVPADYIPLFERVKRAIKGSSRESRTEAFLRYVEQHPNEVIAALEDESEKRIRELQDKHARAARTTLRSSKKPAYTAAELAEVPF